LCSGTGGMEERRGILLLGSIAVIPYESSTSLFGSAPLAWYVEELICAVTDFAFERSMVSPRGRDGGKYEPTNPAAEVGCICSRKLE
jgi:hypothetical protein